MPKILGSKIHSNLTKNFIASISNIEREQDLAIYSRREKEVLCRIGADVVWVNVDDVIIVNKELEATAINRDQK